MTAKAFTADFAAGALCRRYGRPVMVELGGDLAVAGRRPGGWALRVAEHGGGTAQTITLHLGGLATSSTTVRRWRLGGRLVRHIIDPATGAPAEGCWRTVSVAADTANTASTAAIVLGVQAESWLRQRHLAARLVGRDGRVTTTESWPAPVLQVAR